jgi:hypothetical protein
VWLADFLLLGKASLVGFLMSHVFSRRRSTEREVFSSLLFYHIPLLFREFARGGSEQMRREEKK